jgi:cell division protein FtsZ
MRPAAQPRLAPLESDDAPGLSKEDDLLDIPAFLRRQAN